MKRKIKIKQKIKQCHFIFKIMQEISRSTPDKHEKNEQ